MYAIVDAGALIAWAIRTDPDHERVLQQFRRQDLVFVIGALAFAEACYVVATKHGAAAEIGLVREFQPMPIEAPSAEDMTRMAALMHQYRDFPLGAADASVIALAERLKTPYIMTTDRRHFSVVRDVAGRPFMLLPD